VKSSSIKKGKIILFILFAAVLAKATPPKTKDIMLDFVSQLVTLKPYLSSEEKFTSKENEEKIKFSLEKLSEAAQKSTHDPFLKSSNFKFSRQILLEHIEGIEKAFKNGSKPYARWMLNSTVQICLTCHSQLAYESQTFASFVSDNDYKSNFDKAEFLFLVRNYKKSIDLYSQFLSQKVENKEQLDTALIKIMTYYLKVNRNFKDAKIELLKLEKNKYFNVSTKEKIKSWIDHVNKYEKKNVDIVKIKESELLNWISDVLEKEKSEEHFEVILLYASGVLYEYMRINPNSKILPDILYNLAQLDQKISNNFFFSLSDLYLKECIVSHFKSPIAKKCYKQYEQNIKIGYSGSSGTHIPEDVKKELNSLRSTVYGK